MDYTLIWIALIVSLIDWIAVAKGWRRVEYIFKPAIMIVLLVWTWQVSGFEGQMMWFGLGLLFSLFGDIFLMLPKEQFIAGLIAFLLAHVFYIIGLNNSPPPIDFASLILAIFMLLPAVQIYRRIATGLTSINKEKLKIPVLIYSIIISVMLYSALLTLVKPEWEFYSAIPISTGALLFFISDSLLAWNKFVAPLRFGRLTSMVPYHLGQILIIIGAALQFAG